MFINKVMILANYKFNLIIIFIKFLILKIDLNLLFLNLLN